ncbi:hypothetical protein F5X68DRAFT_260912 [Plectosphaerella plurivora]|uniref:DUF7703 domain-containing protein n=1 Tax=Plectosphaerella plurivora TaxID=936078 RepID=A0A9P8VCV7_9PEZI|nr:hypothetical protein F5X68DRAFT_260912 [Plectosphaerella plurivora]
MANTDGGYGRDPPIPTNISLAIVSFIAVAFYNVVELNVILLTTFRNRRSLYFWSFIIAIWGIAVWSLGFLLKDFRLTSSTILYSIFIASGWCAMVTGQSLVLYSRLHLLVYNQNILRAVLGMIIFNAITQHIPTMIVGFGANSADPLRWVRVYPYFEKVNVSVFFLQEMVISGIYVFYTARWLRSDGAVLGEKIGKMLRHLIWINFVIVALDITVLALEFAGHYDIQTAYKGMAYSIKLKLEFQILNDLVSITKASAYSTSRFETGTLVHTTEPVVREVEDGQMDALREEDEIGIDEDECVILDPGGSSIRARVRLWSVGTEVLGHFGKFEEVMDKHTVVEDGLNEIVSRGTGVMRDHVQDKGPEADGNRILGISLERVLDRFKKSIAKLVHYPLTL